MRFLGIILAVAGIAFAFVYPSYQVAHTGEEVAKFRVFDRETGHWKTGWKSHKIRLTSDMAPLRIRLSGKGVSQAIWRTDFIKFNVQLEGQNGISFSNVLDIRVRDSDETDSASTNNNSIPKTLFRVSQDFGIVDNGTYTLSVKPIETFDTSIAYMDTTIVANVEETAKQFQPLGFAALGLGVVLFVLGRRRNRRRESKNPISQKQTAKQKSQKQQSHKWGRQEKDD